VKRTAAKTPLSKKRPAAKAKVGKARKKPLPRPQGAPAVAGPEREVAEATTTAAAKKKKKAAAASKSRAKKTVRARRARQTRAQSEVLAPTATRKAKPKTKTKAKSSASSDKALVKFDPLQRYLAEISNYRLLTREEERELGIRVREYGDKDAAYSLVTSNLRLVVKIALEFQRVWMQNLLDLIQEGNIGLMQAVRKFDPYKNVKFSYYASFWIKAYILKFIMDNWRLVKIGTTQGQRKLFFKLKKEKQKLIEQGFDPKPKLLSERLGVSEKEIVDMDQRLDGWDVSLDAPLKDDSDTERIEFLSTESVSAEDQVAKKEIEVLLHNKIDEFRKNMTDREKEIFDLRIFSDTPVTLQEIGDRYGISRERVRQVEKNIIKKMREFFKREIPDFSAYTEGQEAE
jgi:RNA polymerase sigma-32 factor